MATKKQPVPKTPVQKVATKVGRSVTVESGEVFVIEKNIPITGMYRSVGPNFKYPFSEMLTGDSFEIKAGKEDPRKMVSRVSSACTSFVKRTNSSARFTVRRQPNDGIRVWRVK